MLEHLLSNGAHPSVPSSCGELLTFTGDLDVQDVLDQHRKAHWLESVMLNRIVCILNCLLTVQAPVLLRVSVVCTVHQTNAISFSYSDFSLQWVGRDHH